MEERDYIAEAQVIRTRDASFYRGLGRLSLTDLETTVANRFARHEMIRQRDRAADAIVTFNAVVGTLHPQTVEYEDAERNMHDLLRAIGPEMAQEAQILAKAKQIQEAEAA